jgi:hypothetical protein
MQQPPLAQPAQLTQLAPQANVIPPLLGPQAAPLTYRDMYLDPRYDTFSGNYINLYNDYAIGNTPPAPMRYAVYRDGNARTYLHALLHIREPQAHPHDPGHHLTRHDTGLGLLPTPFNGIGLAYYGDVLNGQVPTTVVMNDTLFNQTNIVQVPTHGLIAQQHAGDPGLQLLGPLPSR